MSSGGVDSGDPMASVADVPLGSGEHIRLLREELELAGIGVEVRTWLGAGRVGVMASLMVPAGKLESAERAVGHLLNLEADDPTDADAYWDLASVASAADAELLTTALADVGIGSMVTHSGEGWDQTIGVLRDDLADAVRLVRRLTDRAPTLELDPDLEGMRLKRPRIPDAARRKQRRRIRRW